MKDLISLNGDGNKVRFMRGNDGDIVIAFDIPGKNLFNESVRIGIGNSGGQEVPFPIKKELIYLCELMERWEKSNPLQAKEEDVYEVNNPYWLSDVFVFQRKHFKSFLYGEIESVCYIKLNDENRIEEIGFDFSKRFFFEGTQKYQKATPSHKKTFLRIDDEFWLRLYDKERHYARKEK